MEERRERELESLLPNEQQVVSMIVGDAVATAASEEKETGSEAQDQAGDEPKQQKQEHASHKFIALVQHRCAMQSNSCPPPSLSPSPPVSPSILLSLPPPLSLCLRSALFLTPMIHLSVW